MNNVRDLLRYKPSEVWTVSPYTSVFQALELMAEKNVGALPVMQEGKLVGMFSERDYPRKCILMGRHSKETRVLELMSSPVVTVNPSVTVEECLELMTNGKLRHLPVIEGGQVTGMVTIGDIGKWIISEQRTAIRDLEGFITGNSYGH